MLLRKSSPDVLKQVMGFETAGATAGSESIRSSESPFKFVRVSRGGGWGSTVLNPPVPRNLYFGLTWVNTFR